MMRFGSLFAGVGGIDLGFEKAGWNCGFQVEWDKNCQQVLNYHWPDIPKWWDVSDVNGADLPPVDLITFGSPCQDLSVAGRRAGLEGGRSGLFFEAVRIIKEMRNATGNVYPKWAVWENVPGAFSSGGGDDFEAVLEEMANVGAYHLEWHCLDAQFFGVPQRRRRVFVIACFDSAIERRGGQEILPVGEGRKRNLKTRRQTQKAVTASVGGSTFGDLFSDLNGGTSGATSSGSEDGDLNSPTEPLIINGTRMNDVRVTTSPINTLPARMGTGGNNVPILAIPIQDGREMEKKQNGLGVGDSGDPSYTLDTTGGQSVAIGFSHTQGLDPQPSEVAFPTLRAGGAGHAVAYVVNDVAGTLTARDYKGADNWTAEEGKLVVQVGQPREAYPIQGTIIGRADTSGPQGPGVGEDGDPMYTLDTVSQHGVAVGSFTKSSFASYEEGVGTLRASGGDLGGGSETLLVEAYDEYNDSLGGSVHHSLRAGTRQSTGVVTAEVLEGEAAPVLAVRRLTPVECEALMGWPKNHTLNRADGATNPDTSRYKMCGNGVASPVAEFIGRHIGIAHQEMFPDL